MCSDEESDDEAPDADEVTFREMVKESAARTDLSALYEQYDGL